MATQQRRESDTRARRMRLKSVVHTVDFSLGAVERQSSVSRARQPSTSMSTGRSRLSSQVVSVERERGASQVMSISIGEVVG